MYFFYIQQIFLEQKLIYYGYFQNTRHFLWVNVTFYDAVNMIHVYDAVNMIHDVITTPNPFPYAAKFMFVDVRNNKTQQIRR